MTLRVLFSFVSWRVPCPPPSPPRASGGIDSAALASDVDALALLVRGVSTHLDVPTASVRLHGMRVGEAIAALTGQDLRFAELDGERASERAGERLGLESGRRAGDRDEASLATASAASAQEAGSVGGDRGSRRRGRSRAGGGNSGGGVGVRGGRGGGEAALRGSPGAMAGGEDALDPDMLLPLGGAGSDSDSDAEGGRGVVSGLEDVTVRCQPTGILRVR